MILISSVLVFFISISSTTAVRTCWRIDSDLQRDCIALVTRDENLCLRLPSPDRKQCLTKIAVDRAVRTRGPSPCKSDGISSDLCYWSLAVELEDESICRKIEHHLDGDNCRALLTGHCGNESSGSCIYYSQIFRENLSFCPTLESPEKLTCYSDIAFLTSSPEACRRIKNENASHSLKGVYSDKCYFNLAQKTESHHLCGKINSSFRRTTCRAVLRKSPELCKTVSNGIHRDYCLLETALEISGLKRL